MWANLITLIRLITILPLSYWIYKDGIVSIWQLIIFCLIIITDALDGFIARKFNMITKIGKILDPIVDKVLVILITIVLLIKSIIPIYSLFIFIRDIVIIIMNYLVLKKNKEYNGSNIYGKAKTVLHFIALAVILLLNKWQIYSLIILTIGFVTVVPEIIYICKHYLRGKKND